jgi:hypothetical protein
MQLGDAQSEATGALILNGYFASLTVGTLVFVLSSMLSKIHNFESPANHSFWSTAGNFSMSFVLVFFASWIAAIVVTALPCAALSWITRKFQIRSWVFYLLAGIALGMLAVVAHVEFFNSFSWYTDPPDETDLTLLQGLLIVGRFLMPAGAAAGVFFWWFTNRCRRLVDEGSC